MRVRSARSSRGERGQVLNAGGEAHSHALLGPRKPSEPGREGASVTQRGADGRPRRLLLGSPVSSRESPQSYPQRFESCREVCTPRRRPQKWRARLSPTHDSSGFCGRTSSLSLPPRPPPHGTFPLQAPATGSRDSWLAAQGQRGWELGLGGTSPCSQFTGAPGTQRGPPGMAEAPGTADVLPVALQGESLDRGMWAAFVMGAGPGGGPLHQRTHLDPKRTTGLAWSGPCSPQGWAHPPNPGASPRCGKLLGWAPGARTWGVGYACPHCPQSALQKRKEGECCHEHPRGRRLAVAVPRWPSRLQRCLPRRGALPGGPM